MTATELTNLGSPTLALIMKRLCRSIILTISVCSLEDFDGEEVDEEALIEQRRQQRLAIVQVCLHLIHPCC